jgi:1,4-alpha-glucan branching enzyme
VFTAPGIPMIFQGQEFLEDKWFHDQDPLDWTRALQYAGILDLYRSLIQLRRNWYNSTQGLRGQHVNVYHVNEADKVLAFHRWDQGGPRDGVVVIVNAANRSYDQYSVGVPRSGLWRVRFNSDWVGFSSDFGNHYSADAFAHLEARQNMPFYVDVGIGPYTVVILSQDS